MGPRKLIKEGALAKAKSGKKLHMFLCSDILVLLDENMHNLYRMVNCVFPLVISQSDVIFKAYTIVPSCRQANAF
jgi:hypothetical protein